MITWNKITESVPAVNEDDKFDKDHKISKKCLVKVIHIDGLPVFAGPAFSFGRYYYDREDWVIEGYLGNFTAFYWSELNDPKV
jgi:hypothetical protein